ncbi:MAG: glycosyltransferase family 4 protein [Ramlibacter sp.]|jgi:glycosyltransferase involved in cell wall biosynthesis|nr:glycosyltransferase family 4 protein [Ramlibacter sp.]
MKTAGVSAPDGQRMKIAVLNRVFARTGGGAESYSIALVEQLAQRHEVHVFAQQIDHDWPGVTYHRVSRIPKPRWVNQLWYAFATWRATRRGFDVVHSHENTWHGRVQTIHVKPVRHNLLAGRTGVRLALAWIKIALSPRLITYVALEAARFRAQPGQQVVVTSDNLRAEVLQAYPHAAPLLSVVTPGVTLPGPGMGKAAAREALGLPQQGRLLLFVANDYARKGLDGLLQALAALPPDVCLAVVGNPAGIPAFKARAQALGVAGRVHFLGALKSVDPAYRAADVLVHPTLEDTFAMVVLEAMAHGLPVVVSGPAYCGIASLLTHGHDALLLDDPRDAAAIAAALGQLLGDAALAVGMGAAARRSAQGHSWDAAARACEQVYRRSLTPPA